MAIPVVSVDRSALVSAEKAGYTIMALMQRQKSNVSSDLLNGDF